MSVFSLKQYLQHWGATPQGPEDEWQMTPALLQMTVHCHLDFHAAGCCPDPPVQDNAAKKHQALGLMVVFGRV